MRISLLILSVLKSGIIIELDGGQHKLHKEKDNERDRFFAENEFTVLRFWDNDVFENLEGVLEVIRKKCHT